ncbi:MAG: 30S ribosomal protein S12 methylthiotransferase RimO [Clostridia bacterium]|nr:30S ribosomal protein S12 methylthiotransferase RimO [Clostridia bacterium]
MKKKIGMVSLGCPKNLVDSEIMLGLLNKNEFEITNNESEAQVIIVNTCGFIESAKKESINTILEMAEYKQQNCELLIVTGCLAERYKNDIASEIPEIDAVLGTGSYGEIAKVIEKAYGGERPVVHGTLDELEYLENNRVISTRKGSAYLKVAEGCDNCCTYCIIPSLRGKYRSRKMESILKEAQGLAENGVKELILIAQDTTRYGLDLYGERKLVDLIQRLSAVEGVQWIRLLYCYPEMIDDALIQEMADNPKVCKYIDMPVQHASDKILRTMNRRDRAEDIEGLLMKLKQRIPGVVIRTSLIVGFPGETEEDFDILYRFAEKFRFDRLGVFTYSKEENTPAARLKSQVSKKVKEQRYNRIMELQKSITDELNEERIGKIYDAVVEGVSEDGIFYYGRTYAEAPDIDGVVYFVSQEPLNEGDFVQVKILAKDEYDLTGEVVYESGE